MAKTTASSPAPYFNFDAAQAALKVTGPSFSLAQISPDDTPGLIGDVKKAKAQAQAEIERSDPALAELQERMFAQARVENPDAPAVLLVLQGMDTSGKGGVVRHVLGAVDPQGLQLASFKAPTEEERQHDFLWRIDKKLPQRGHIGVFDRSHYEDVLIQRVRQFAPAAEIERRYGAIVDFEQRVQDSGTKLIKVMLHISKDEQGERLQERLERPDKHWKYNPGDIDERELWDEYQQAYEIAIQRTATEQAPWWVVPANRKWYARLMIKHLIRQTLDGLNLEWPKADFDPAVELQRLKQS